MVGAGATLAWTLSFCVHPAEAPCSQSAAVQLPLLPRSDVRLFQERARAAQRASQQERRPQSGGRELQDADHGLACPIAGHGSERQVSQTVHSEPILSHPNHPILHRFTNLSRTFTWCLAWDRTELPAFVFPGGKRKRSRSAADLESRKRRRTTSDSSTLAAAAADSLSNGVEQTNGVGNNSPAPLSDSAPSTPTLPTTTSSSSSSTATDAPSEDASAATAAAAAAATSSSSTNTMPTDAATGAASTTTSKGKKLPEPPKLISVLEDLPADELAPAVQEQEEEQGTPTLLRKPVINLL